MSGKHWCQFLPVPLPIISLLRRQAVRRHAGLRHCWLHLSLFLCVPLHLEDDHMFVTCTSFGCCDLRRCYGVTYGGDDTHLLQNTKLIFPHLPFFPLFLSLSFFFSHLLPASFHPGLDLKFHSKGAISAPLAKWVIILSAMPTLNLYKCSHTSNSSLAS